MRIAAAENAPGEANWEHVRDVIRYVHARHHSGGWIPTWYETSYEVRGHSLNPHLAAPPTMMSTRTIATTVTMSPACDFFFGG
jgi:hypothetical protein